LYVLVKLDDQGIIHLALCLDLILNCLLGRTVVLGKPPVEEFIFLFQCLEEKKRVIFVAQIAISGASRAREFISGQAKITPDGHDDAGKGHTW
jgi:hypothetical protein